MNDELAFPGTDDGRTVAEFDAQIKAHNAQVAAPAAPVAQPVSETAAPRAPLTDEQHRRDSVELRRLCAERDRLRKALSDKRAILLAGRDSYETACAPMNSDDEAWDDYLRAHGIGQEGASK